MRCSRASPRRGCSCAEHYKVHWCFASRNMSWLWLLPTWITPSPVLLLGGSDGWKRSLWAPQPHTQICSQPGTVPDGPLRQHTYTHTQIFTVWRTECKRLTAGSPSVHHVRLLATHDLLSDCVCLYSIRQQTQRHMNWAVKRWIKRI